MCIRDRVHPAKSQRMERHKATGHGKESWFPNTRRYAGVTTFSAATCRGRPLLGFTASRAATN